MPGTAAAIRQRGRGRVSARRRLSPDERSKQVFRRVLVAATVLAGLAAGALLFRQYLAAAALALLAWCVLAAIVGGLIAAVMRKRP